MLLLLRLPTWFKVVRLSMGPDGNRIDRRTDCKCAHFCSFFWSGTLYRRVKQRPLLRPATMSDEAPPKDEQVMGDAGAADEDVPPPGQGVASSKSSLSEAESILSDMMKRQATIKAPSGGADILAAGRQLGKDGNDNDNGDDGKKKHAFWETQPMKVNESDGSGGGSKKAAKFSKREVRQPPTR